MTVDQKALKDALDKYLELREELDSLNPFSSYDVELRGPELRADLDAAAYLLADAAEQLLVEV